MKTYTIPKSARRGYYLDTEYTLPVVAEFGQWVVLRHPRRLYVVTHSPTGLSVPTLRHENEWFSLQAAKKCAELLAATPQFFTASDRQFADNKKIFRAKRDEAWKIEAREFPEASA